MLLAVPSVPQLAQLKKLARFLFYPVLANNLKKSSLLAARISEQICHSSNHALTSQSYGLLRLAPPPCSLLSHYVLKVFPVGHLLLALLFLKAA